jgi:preprotein translocase subunit SecG
VIVRIKEPVAEYILSQFTGSTGHPTGLFRLIFIIVVIFIGMCLIYDYFEAADFELLA